MSQSLGAFRRFSLAKRVLPWKVWAPLRRFNTPTRESDAEATDNVAKAEPASSVEFIPECSYSVSSEEFKWVERLLPPSVVPQPPEHGSYPTPSGWISPSAAVPDEPYFVRRTKYHELPVLEIEKPQKSGRWLTTVRNVDGDIWTLEEQLVELVKPHLRFDPATRVHELTQAIWIKGLHKEIIERFLYDKGF